MHFPCVDQTSKSSNHTNDDNKFIRCHAPNKLQPLKSGVAGNNATLHFLRIPSNSNYHPKHLRFKFNTHFLSNCYTIYDTSSRERYILAHCRSLKHSRSANELLIRIFIATSFLPIFLPFLFF